MQEALSHCDPMHTAFMSLLKSVVGNGLLYIFTIPYEREDDMEHERPFFVKRAVK